MTYLDHVNARDLDRRSLPVPRLAIALGQLADGRDRWFTLNGGFHQRTSSEVTFALKLDRQSVC
jgi:hypothetical protein